MRVDQFEKPMRAAIDQAAQDGVYAIARCQDYLGVDIKHLNGNTKQQEVTEFRGVGVQVITPEGYIAFGSTDEISESNLRDLVSTLAGSARGLSAIDGVRTNTRIFDVEPTQARELIPLTHKVEETNIQDLEKVVRGIHESHRAIDTSVTLETWYQQVEEQWMVMRSDGTDVRFNLPYTRLIEDLTKGPEGGKQTVMLKLNGMDGNILYAAESRELLEMRYQKSLELVTKLIGKGKLPPGQYKAALSSFFIGLFSHEAVGHPVESDNGKYSIFGSDDGFNMGAQVAGSNISLIDAPIPGKWGDVRYSVNGVKRRPLTLIRDGRLADSISDVFSAHEASAEINGCARSQMFKDPAIPRMSNTYLVDSDPYQAELNPETTTIEELYAVLEQMGELKPGEKVVVPVGPNGGQVFTEKGEFMFNCRGIYLLENRGKTFGPSITLYGPSCFAGKTLGALETRMRGIGNTIFNDDSGTCGKSGQGAKVSDGGHAYMVMDKTEAVTFG